MMMKEIALHILDIAQNSITAGATLIEIDVHADMGKDELTVAVKDNGCGMTPEQCHAVEDPFTTSRTTRKVGLGIPFFKEGALMCEGTFSLQSEKNVGTVIAASYRLSHIDRPPLGDMAETMLSIVICNTDIDFIYRYSVDGNLYTFDTREIKSALGPDVPLNIPEVVGWIRDNLKEGIEEINNSNTDGGITI